MTLELKLLVGLALVAGLLGLFGWQQHELDAQKGVAAAANEGRQADRAAMATVAAASAAENAAKTNMILNSQAKAADDADNQRNRADAAERAAAKSAVGLRAAARALAAASHCDVSSSPAAGASSPADRLADVLATSADRYRSVAEVADRAIIAGQQCERSYDALNPVSISLGKLKLGG